VVGVLLGGARCVVTAVVCHMQCTMYCVYSCVQLHVAPAAVKHETEFPIITVLIECFSIT
jgi:hypothetical protein